MKRSTLELLCCPHCRVALSLQDEHGEEIVAEGCLLCPDCKRCFPIRDGIAYFVGSQEIEGINRRFARFYDWFSRFYEPLTKAMFLSFGGERRARKVILDRLELRGGRVLEVSIGTGANLPYLFESPDAGEVFGLDISAGELARCSRRVSARDWPVDLFLATAEALPFRERSFDSVFHIGGINFFSKKRQAIEEMIRVAKPGTKIVIADESERLAGVIARIGGFSRSCEGKGFGSREIVDLVPETMEDVRLDGIWKAHFQYHGYCLEFRKPL
jgi:ubiquinone/menaquinone biosynthesis C-methylase UbiE